MLNTGKQSCGMCYRYNYDEKKYVLKYLVNMVVLNFYLDLVSPYYFLK